MIYRLILFLLLNFGALAIGGFFTGPGVSSEWYSTLNKAPWTPPGWVFGAAWTSIMICFSLYLVLLWPEVESKGRLIILFVLQWILNVSWNPVFFHFHQAGFGLLIIASLTIVVGIMLLQYWTDLKNWSVLLAPYFLWLLIATSLNAYIYINN